MTSRIHYNNPQSSGAFGLPYHYEMVSDVKRVHAFKQAIMQACKGKRVLESGAGTGIMSILAARAGAKKVYAVEVDPVVARFLKNNIQKKCLQHCIKLIIKDIRKVDVQDLDGEKVDVVIAENLSTWQVTEPQIPIMNYINGYLIKKEGICLPSVIFNYVEVVQSQFSFEDAIEMRTHYFEFTGIKRPRLLSEKTLVSHIDLAKKNALHVGKTVRIKVRHSGIMNGLRLTSPILVYKKTRFDGSDSLMPPVIIPCKKDMIVKKGDVVELKISYDFHTDWKHVAYHIKSSHTAI